MAAQAAAEAAQLQWVTQLRQVLTVVQVKAQAQAAEPQAVTPVHLELTESHLQAALLVLLFSDLARVAAVAAQALIIQAAAQLQMRAAVPMAAWLAAAVAAGLALPERQRVRAAKVAKACAE